MNRLFTFLFLSLLFNIVQAQLRSPKYQKGKAILSDAIANYNPGNHPDLKVGTPNIMMGAVETLFPTVEADGSFKISIPLYHNTQVRMMIGKVDIVVLLSPDKETDVAVNLSNPQGRQFVFSGQYATINSEWCQSELITGIAPVYRNGDILDSIVGINANEFKKRCVDQYKQCAAHNNTKTRFSEDTRTLANLSCVFNCTENPDATHHCLQTAYQKKRNITREQTNTAFASFDFPTSFYDFLENFPINCPLALYCYNYRNVISGELYGLHHDPLKFEKYLLSKAALTKEEQALIHQYETTLKIGIPFQRGSGLIALIAKCPKEYNEFSQKLSTKAKEYLSHIMQDSTCLMVDCIRAIYVRFGLYNSKPLTTQREAMATEITDPIFLGIIQDTDRRM